MAQSRGKNNAGITRENHDEKSDGASMTYLSGNNSKIVHDNLPTPPAPVYAYNGGNMNGGNMNGENINTDTHTVQSSAVYSAEMNNSLSVGNENAEPNNSNNNNVTVSNGFDVTVTNGYTPSVRPKAPPVLRRSESGRSDTSSKTVKFADDIVVCMPVTDRANGSNFGGNNGASSTVSVVTDNDNGNMPANITVTKDVEKTVISRPKPSPWPLAGLFFLISAVTLPFGGLGVTVSVVAISVTAMQVCMYICMKVCMYVYVWLICVCSCHLCGMYVCIFV